MRINAAAELSALFYARGWRLSRDLRLHKPGSRWPRYMLAEKNQKWLLEQLLTHPPLSDALALHLNDTMSRRVSLEGIHLRSTISAAGLENATWHELVAHPRVHEELRLVVYNWLNSLLHELRPSLTGD